ncbi:MAG TPA: response regulator [Patescibacteria group bacterium]|nr:response regulator [Patescibacteria group bacterium]
MEDLKVVIIDDDIWMQRILSKTLQNLGFACYIAANGFEGVALAVEHRPVLIISDILMPEFSGHLTLKMLKTIKSTKHIPVVMVTAVSDKENLGLAVKAGAVGFIRKPFTRNTILEKLRDVLGVDLMNNVSVRSHLETDRETLPAPDNINEQSEVTEDIEQWKADHLPTVPQDQLSKRYQDDDKRNLDAVKALLLKTKKNPGANGAAQP